ncbi:uncharacterized protein LOC119024475 [Acanthopagrus latus]|uniref:uncharacterized protein LOC119024475 n=1 Tax=Acanthopagrus latus TaxID=8177 RepID=UPI00187C2898|nr:uncharacterized protein LOC119024475 [Acanthopagrus latus]
MRFLCIAALFLSAVAAHRGNNAPDGGGSGRPGLVPGKPGPSKHFWRRHGPSRGNRKFNGSFECSPVFKVDNVTFQNVSAVTLKEGENKFVMLEPQAGGRGPRHHLQKQYVKLNYTEPNHVSVEYGVVKFVPASIPPRGPSEHFGRPQGGSRGNGHPKKRNLVFSPAFKVDNVTFQPQNGADVTLKEGENIFLIPKHIGRGPHHPQMRELRGRPKPLQYVKLNYTAAQPNQVSIEYGLVKYVEPAELVEEDDYSEDDY